MKHIDWRNKNNPGVEVEDGKTRVLTFHSPPFMKAKWVLAVFDFVMKNILRHVNMGTWVPLYFGDTGDCFAIVPAEKTAEGVATTRNTQLLFDALSLHHNVMEWKKLQAVAKDKVVENFISGVIDCRSCMCLALTRLQLNDPNFPDLCTKHSLAALTDCYTHELATVGELEDKLVTELSKPQNNIATPTT